jgi:hypothetical protein
MPTLIRRRPTSRASAGTTPKRDNFDVGAGTARNMTFIGEQKRDGKSNESGQ